MLPGVAYQREVRDLPSAGGPILTALDSVAAGVQMSQTNSFRPTCHNAKRPRDRISNFRFESI